MNKILTVALALLMLNACKPKEYGAFIVTGKILHAPATAKLLLQDMPFNGNKPVVIDSTTIKKDGSFTLRGVAREEGIYRLSIDEQGPSMLFVNDEHSIHIQFDAADFRKPLVKGSKATTGLYDFLDKYRAKDSVLIGTFMAIDTLRVKAGTDSLIQVQYQKREQQLKALNRTITDFLKQTESAASSFYVIALGAKSMLPEELKPLADEASAKFKEHSGLAILKSQIAMEVANTKQDAPYALLNQQAPELTMTDVTGKPVSISSFKGKYLLIDFWASWCGPCREENPNVVAAYKQFKNKNFEILGVSLDSDKAKWVQAIGRDSLSWPQMSDLKQWESAAVGTYKFNAIPFNVLIDPTGKIIASKLTGAALQQKLAEVLK